MSRSQHGGPAGRHAAGRTQRSKSRRGASLPPHRLQHSGPRSPPGPLEPVCPGCSRALAGRSRTTASKRTARPAGPAASTAASRACQRTSAAAGAGRRRRTGPPAPPSRLAQPAATRSPPRHRRGLCRPGGRRPRAPPAPTCWAVERGRCVKSGCCANTKGVKQGAPWLSALLPHNLQLRAVRAARPHSHGKTSAQAVSLGRAMMVGYKKNTEG